MTDITIPPEALQKAWEKYLLDGCGPYAFEAACQAILKAWPGMSDIPAGEFDGEQYPRIIHLPLTENTSDEG